MKIQPIKFTNQLTNVLHKTKAQQLSLPIVATPIIAYYVGESQDKNVDEILNFFKRKHIKVPDFLKPHADTQTGLNGASQTKIKQALNEAYQKDKISYEEYKKYTNKVNFTGHGNAESLAESDSDWDSHAGSGTDIDVDDDDSILDAILDFLDDLF